MRHLSATFSVREVARDQYVHSKYSRELVANPAVDAFKYMYVASSCSVSFPDSTVKPSLTITSHRKS